MSGCPSLSSPDGIWKELFGDFEIFSFVRGASAFGFASSIAAKLNFSALPKDLILFERFDHICIKSKLT